jgi:preprotein translocase subunit YajC
MPSHFAYVFAASNSSGGGGAIVQLGILLLIPFAMYFFLIRPQRKRARDQQELQRAIQIGDEVVMTSGVYGKVTGEDGPTRFWLEIDDDVQIRIARAAIQGRVTDGDEANALEPADAADLDD